MLMRTAPTFGLEQQQVSPGRSVLAGARPYSNRAFRSMVEQISRVMHFFSSMECMA